VTFGVFESQMERLRPLRFTPADFGSHWEALQDIPDELFTAAVSHALRTRAEFPMPAELRADTDAVARRQARPQAVHPTSRLVPIEGSIPVEIKNPLGGPSIHVHVTNEPRYDCTECDDSGMVKYWCGESPSTRWPWLYRRHCGRHHSHADHDWAGPCPCVPTNPTIQDRRARMAAKFSQEPEKVQR
jgi:hypothetical protein